MISISPQNPRLNVGYNQPALKHRHRVLPPLVVVVVVVVVVVAVVVAVVVVFSSGGGVKAALNCKQLSESDESTSFSGCLLFRLISGLG